MEQSAASGLPAYDRAGDDSGFRKINLALTGGLVVTGGILFASGLLPWRSGRG